MKVKLAVLGGAAVGFVLGSRAGREPYEQLAAYVRKLSGRSGLGDATQRLRDTGLQAKDTASAVAETGAERAAAAAAGGVNAATDKAQAVISVAKDLTEDKEISRPPDHAPPSGSSS